MTSVLQTILVKTRETLAIQQAETPLDVLLNKATPCPVPRRLETILADPTRPTHVITEIKPASPSQGVLAPGALDLPGLIARYETIASAYSVLTDGPYFGGSLELLEAVGQLTDKPRLRKDFILDPYQLAQARVAGAEAVLLIVKALSTEQLHTLHTQTLRWGMTPVVEINSESELSALEGLEPTVLLINNRNLDTLAIDLATTATLAPLVPSGWQIVSASGIEGPADIERLRPYTHRFLIGTALMRAWQSGTLPDLLKALAV